MRFGQVIRDCIWGASFQSDHLVNFLYCILGPQLRKLHPNASYLAGNTLPQCCLFSDLNITCWIFNRIPLLRKLCCSHCLYLLSYPEYSKMWYVCSSAWIQENPSKKHKSLAFGGFGLLSYVRICRINPC